MKSALPLVPAALGIVSVVLIYLVGRSLTSSRALGLTIAAFLALMPLMFLNSMVVAGPLYQVPFAVGWLLCVERHRVTPAGPWLRWAGVVLGLGLYGHPAGLITMPVYLALSVAALLIGGGVETARSRVVEMVAAFAITALPRAGFLVSHPDYLAGHIAANRLYDSSRYNLLQGAREMFSWVGLTARVEVFYDYFSPSLLFLPQGGVGPSLLHPDVFLLPFAVLLPLGLFLVVTRGANLTLLLVVGGFLVAPLVPSLTARPPEAGRLLLMAPFAAVLAGHGARELLLSPRLALRALGGVLCAAVPACFVLFYVNLPAAIRD